MLSRGAAAELAGVNPETLRYYEKRRLITLPTRATGGYREYSPEIIDRVRFIKRAQELGFALEEIRELLELRGDGADCAQVRERALQKIRAVEERISDLERIKAALVSLAERCLGEGPVERCPIISALRGGGHDG